MSDKIWGLFFAHLFLSVAFATSDRSEEKIRLTEIQRITLRQGWFTNHRREPPVRQLRCIGGTAGCKAYIPEVVNCYNRGSNAYGVEWECKLDVDNLYRLGTVQVTCEGYAHSKDPFVLKDSCGLIYTIDFRTEGNQNQENRGFLRSIWFSAKSGLTNIFVAFGLCAFFFILFRLYFRKSASSNNLNADKDSVEQFDYPINTGKEKWSATKTRQASNRGAKKKSSPRQVDDRKEECPEIENLENSNDEPRIFSSYLAKKRRQEYSNDGAKKKYFTRVVDDRKDGCSETEIAGAMASGAIAGCFLGSTLFGNNTQEDNLRFRYPNFAHENTHHSFDNEFNRGSFGGGFGFDNTATYHNTGNILGADSRVTSGFGGTTLR